MPRKRHEAQYEATREDIKIAARQLMAANGTSGLSTRAVAKMVGLTAPALYHYYTNLDDLITALIVDAFNALADAMHAASEAEKQRSYAHQIHAAVLAYRDYAVAYPVDFQLIYGNPIPGYEAPSEITIPLARRPFETIIQVMIMAHEAGKMQLPAEYQSIPASISTFMQQWSNLFGAPIPSELLYALIVGWSRIHGMVMLELFNHTPPTVGDPAAFYEKEVDVYLKTFGLSITD